MQANELKNFVRMFGDPGEPIVIENGTLLFSMNGESIEAKLTMDSGDVYVLENELREPASKWIVRRLARLHLLANRLLDGIESNEAFVSPDATFVKDLSSQDGAAEQPMTDALNGVLRFLGDKTPLQTTVLYLTSNAGEGKTSLINAMARAQATAFLNKSTDWLLVPIALGGRHFLRFDDITVGALQNKYRFSFLYYQSFLALVRMGVIVPAFDGFEEMFVEGSSGEALSAMGTLVGALDSTGKLLVAARKAYFEFENLRDQQQLFDSIRTFSVAFYGAKLEKWNRGKFVEYGRKRNHWNSDAIYQQVRNKLGEGHPVLTRPVLVNYLFSLLRDSQSIDDCLEALKASGANYYAVFISQIIRREAAEKWIDRSGAQEVGQPLLTVAEHFEILSMVAISMWESRVEFLKKEGLEFVADYFCEVHKKSSQEAQQIRERLYSHALIVPSRNAKNAVEFDHFEIRTFFLGEGAARAVLADPGRATLDLLNIFRQGTLPSEAIVTFVRYLKLEGSVEISKSIDIVLRVAMMDVQTSFAQENCSNCLLSLLDQHTNDKEIEVSRLIFANEVLRGKKLHKIIFSRCYFSVSTVDLISITDCVFDQCNILQLKLEKAHEQHSVEFRECIIDSISLPDGREYWDPHVIQKKLIEMGLVKGAQLSLAGTDAIDTLESIEIQCVRKLIRYFIRSTHIGESVIRMKLGPHSSDFIDRALPVLIQVGMMIEIENKGGSEQRRYRLGISLSEINHALSKCQGSFENFQKQLETGDFRKI